VLTLGEIRKGAELLPDGRRRERLRAWLRSELPAQFEERVLPITPAVALAWGRFAAEAQRSGRPLHVVDGLLLATAEVHGLTLVTRNVGDFRDRGLPIENPYSP
jgi:predicted nucleic acid-binding protein